MFASKNEEIFFMDHLKEHHKVLEYGSGNSTIEISKKVKEVISIEHQESWFNNISQQVSDNCKIILKSPNLHYTEGGHCGTYEEFKDYVDSPIGLGPFDIILIDGRARVWCASIAEKVSHKDTIIFVHDFDREEYQPILNYLELIERVENMAKFKVKK
jgi:protein O-GlcNAc transferase